VVLRGIIPSETALIPWIRGVRQKFSNQCEKLKKGVAVATFNLSKRLVVGKKRKNKEKRLCYSRNVPNIENTKKVEVERGEFVQTLQNWSLGDMG
jgi:hypothetical protein